MGGRGSGTFKGTDPCPLERQEIVGRVEFQVQGSIRSRAFLLSGAQASRG